MSDRYFYSTAAKWSFVGFTVLVLSTWIASAGFEHVDMALFGYYIAAVICMIGMVVRLTLFFACHLTSIEAEPQTNEGRKETGR
jgi:fucose 4-O-acetylase-like acetyltransferase